MFLSRLLSTPYSYSTAIVRKVDAGREPLSVFREMYRLGKKYNYHKMTMLLQFHEKRTWRRTRHKYELVYFKKWHWLKYVTSVVKYAIENKLFYDRKPTEDWTEVVKHPNARTYERQEEDARHTRDSMPILTDRPILQMVEELRSMRETALDLETQILELDEVEARGEVLGSEAEKREEGDVVFDMRFMEDDFPSSSSVDFSVPPSERTETQGSQEDAGGGVLGPSEGGTSLHERTPARAILRNLKEKGGNLGVGWRPSVFLRYMVSRHKWRKDDAEVLFGLFVSFIPAVAHCNLLLKEIEGTAVQQGLLEDPAVVEVLTAKRVQQVKAYEKETRGGLGLSASELESLYDEYWRGGGKA
uniref:Uncharacterized protein n=1 Tax=Chromera velia CCMP2878 TaxID=1169474 RepID=A0A0G4HB30_9ALVE|eukprot:Cvel_25817.t1-p1 / transcript=Cvel_25817.t1 / gene=Cvel_25817 / organism=Chromera_velia_CCMP2878 / gene_product=hypothetical protein / transcript_product=hypothetical protein / location=Cvel_scaffold2977:2680-4242(-) / protein_length=358 / sequence_SO=supercontig / SO=protein_coding / is_pseudo=false